VKTFLRRRLRRAAIILPALIIVAVVMTRIERQRIQSTATAPAATPQPGRIDAGALYADLQKLASPAMEGRRTGSPGSRAAQQMILERFRELKVQPLFGADYRQPFSFTHKSIRGLISPSRPYKTDYPEATNLGAVIRGTSNPDRFIALTAHYDSFGVRDGQLFSGADDNASGVATMLAVGRVIAAQPLAHSVVLLAFDAEELGLRGARHFVNNPPLDVKRIDAVVNLDMVGRGDTNVLVAAGTSYTPAFEAPARTAASARPFRVMFGHDRPLYKAGLVENWTGSSDHGPFHDAGVPFIYLGVEDHADYHQPGDTADKIRPAFPAEVGNFVLDLMIRLDALPPRVP